MAVPVEKLIPKLRGLYYAEICMREVYLGSDHIENIGKHPSELANVLAAGIVISYTRPFGQNDGLSRISPDFEKFPKADQEALHQYLIDARNQIYAHKDLLNHGKRLRAGMGPEDVKRVKIIVLPDGRTAWELQQVKVPDEYFKSVATLARFQAERMNRASSEILSSIVIEAQKVRGPHAPGNYYLGENFP